MLIMVEKDGKSYGSAMSTQELGELVEKALADGGTVTQIELTDLLKFFS